MSQYVRESGGQVGRETVLRPSEAPMPVLAEGTAPVSVILAEGTAPVAMPAPSTSARRIWPWLAGSVVLAAGALTASMLVAQRSDRAAFEKRYPIVADAGERDTLDREGARWTRGKTRLLASLARFTPPPLETLTGAGACPLAIDGASDLPTTDDPDAAISTRLIVLPGESHDGLDALARDEIERMIAATERARFRTDEGKTRVLQAIRGSFVVALVSDHAPPGTGRDGVARVGTASGTAFAFDPATGALRCAGSFRASADESSFEASTITAIGSSLRAVD